MIQSIIFVHISPKFTRSRLVIIYIYHKLTFATITLFIFIPKTFLFYNGHFLNLQEIYDKIKGRLFSII